MPNPWELSWQQPADVPPWEQFGGATVLEAPTELRGEEVRTLPTVADTTGGGKRWALASPSEMAASLADAPAEFWQNLNTPIYQIPHLDLPDLEGIGPAAGFPVEQGVVNAGADLASFFTSPLGISTLGMGAFPKAVQRVVALAFAGQMASQTPELASELGTELGRHADERDPERIAYLITSGAANTGLAALAGAHATGFLPGQVRTGFDNANRLAGGRKTETSRPVETPPADAIPAQTLPVSEPKPWELDYGPGGEMPPTPAVGGEMKNLPSPEGAKPNTKNVPAASMAPSRAAESGAPGPATPPEQSGAPQPLIPPPEIKGLPSAGVAPELKRLVKVDLAADPRLDEPGISRKAQPNRLILQMRDLESHPIGEIDVPATGDPLVDSKTAAALINKHADSHRVSLRESSVTSTGPNGRGVYRYAMSPNGVAWASVTDLVKAREQTRSNPPAEAPDIRELAKAQFQQMKATEAKAVKPAGTRAAAKEFDKLILDYGMEAGWIAEPDVLYEASVDIGSNHGTASIKAKIARSKALAAARRNAFADLGANKLDVGDLSARAALLPKLKEYVDTHHPAPEKQAADFSQATSAGKVAVPVSELKVGETLTIEGEAVKVAEITPDGDVVLEDGKRFGRQTLNDGSLIYAEEWQAEAAGDFAPVEAAQPPQLRPGEKAGEMFQGADQPFNLMGEAAVDPQRIAAEKAQAAANAQANAAFQAEHQQGFQGMGGAVPAEFQPAGGTASSIKNATVDVERSRRGLPPAMQPARRDFGTVWDEAMAIVDSAPEAQDRLIEVLKAKPRSVTDVEDALLLQRQIDLQNEYGKATRDLAAAYDDAQQFPNRLEAVEQHKAQVASLSDRLLELYDLNKAVGTATARGLNARKMMANEDFTLAKMELEMRAAKEGAPLTEAERGQLAELQDQIARSQAAFDEKVAKLEQEKADRRVDETIADLQAELKRRPAYGAKVFEIATEIVNKLKKQAEKSDVVLDDFFKRTNTGIDPTILYHLGVKGAAMIAERGLDFAKFSVEMAARFGDKVKPYLQAAWDKANLHLENEGAKYGDKAPQVKQLLRKRDAMGRRETVIDGLKKGKAEEIPVTVQGDYIRKLAEGFVEAGIRTRDALVDAVHEVLTKEVGLDLTRRETMDAISGYGAFKPLNPDVIKATMRDLKGQLQQVAKLEDIQGRRPMPKTGVERRAPSDEERRLIQQVNEAKRKFGVVVSDPARQLKSALDAVTKRLKNQIADLEYQINTKERIVKTRTPAPFDANTRLLEVRRDDLRRQLEELLPRPGLTDAQRLAQAQKNIERSIADYEQRIAAGDVAVRQAKPTLTSPQLEALKVRRDALRAEHQALVEAADPGRADRAALSALKSRLKTATAEYQDRLARGDFSKRRVREVVLDKEALGLKAENEKWKTEYQRRLIQTRLAQRSLAWKLYGLGKETLNLPRNILSSWDVSAVLRQGGFIAVGNPGRAARSIGPMFRALLSDKATRIIEQEILSRENAPVYRRAKLYLAPHDAVHLAAMEEAVMSRFSHLVPGIRASNRAYITFLNKLRADSFDAMKSSIESRGTPLNAVELEAIANYINVATGRGNLYKFTSAAETLATVFFSPRLMASRFQLVAGQPLYHGSARTRAAVAREYAKFLAGMAVIYTLGSLAGAKIGNDRRSSDFGKLVVGNTRIDPLAGISQTSVLLSRLQTGESVGQSGQAHPIRGSNLPYGSDTSWDVIARFLRSKLSPVVGAGVDLATGQNVVGDKVTPGNVASRLVVPLSFGDIYEAMKEQGVPAGTALGMLSLFGWGLQTYQPKHDAAEVVAGRQLQQSPSARGLTPEAREQWRSYLANNLRQHAATNAAAVSDLNATAETLRAMQQRAEQRRQGFITNGPPK